MIGEAVVSWKSQASFDLMILTRLLYLAVENDGTIN